MDYTFNNMQIHTKATRNNREETKCRLLVYLILLRTRIQPIKENNTVSDKEGCLSTFWNKESYWEQKIYRKMKKWEARHPITGIVLCTILGTYE